MSRHRSGTCSSPAPSAYRDRPRSQCGPPHSVLLKVLLLLLLPQHRAATPALKLAPPTGPPLCSTRVEAACRAWTSPFSRTLHPSMMHNQKWMPRWAPSRRSYLSLAPRILAGCACCGSCRHLPVRYSVRERTSPAPCPSLSISFWLFLLCVGARFVPILARLLGMVSVVALFRLSALPPFCCLFEFLLVVLSVLHLCPCLAWYVLCVWGRVCVVCVLCVCVCCVFSYLMCPPVESRVAAVSRGRTC